MKKLIVLLVAVMAAFSLNAEVVRQGTTFSVSTTKSGKPSISTKYTWKDSKGVTYGIKLSPRGAAYILKTSKKTGKEYKQYLPKEVSETIAKELQQ